MAGPGARTWRDAAALAGWARSLLWLAAAFSAVTMFLAWRRGFVVPAGTPEDLLPLAQLAVFIAAALAALLWIHRANANAHALGAADMMVSPGWAVGWYFVPLMNLVMPYLAMRELWKASARPGDWQLEPAPPTILAWWLLWLASGVAGTIALRLSLEFGKEGASAAEMFAFGSDLAFIPAALLLAWIIGRIQAMQTRAVPAGIFG